MPNRRYTLIAEGPSDRALMPIIDWALRQNASVRFTGSRASLRFLDPAPRGLEARVATALELYPCDLLLVHRDGNTVGRAGRAAEIRAALGAQTAVCVVPVRSTETWLLFDETALRLAARRPNGRVQIDLPRLARLEALAQPKQELQSLLRLASEARGRRRKKFNTSEALQRLATLIPDFSALRGLSAFAAFEEELRRELARLDCLAPD